MTQITLWWDKINTIWNLPQVWSIAKNFVLVDKDLSEKSLEDFLGKRIILNIFPSLDTDVCSLSVKKFNKTAAWLQDTIVICVSKDLPFAIGRFCGAEWIEHIVTLSDFRWSFGEDYGLTISDGVLRWVLSRAIIILDKNHEIIYTQQVLEITTEPDYDQALSALSTI